jgi:type IV pilus assembly protein PilZ
MNSDAPGANRRTAERHAIELKVEYKRLNTFFADYTKNISKGGTFIRTEKPLDIGTEFVFALTIPQLADAVKLRGKVVWTTPPDKATEESPCGMGIKFQYASDDERLQTEAVVERLMRSELGEQISARLLGREPHK